MASPINIPAILIANAMGIAILFAVATANFWGKNESISENRYLFIMFCSCLVNCIADPLCFLADGRPGLFSRILVIGCNSLLYFGGALLSLMWIYVVADRLKIRLHKYHRAALLVLFGTVIFLLLLNFFVPVLFTTDENNVYARLGGYWVYVSCYAIFMLDGLLLYLRARHASGSLKFFPVWAFLIPAVVGLLLQSIFYGISTSIPFATVSIVCMILCLQSEFMVRDKLTGLYNRFYLDAVAKRLHRNPKLQYTAFMLDINGFKKINDTFGHQVGDEALILLASILTEAVGQVGEIVRYAGDEFIIVLNTQDDAQMEAVIARIYELLDELNKKKSVPFELSIAAGYCRINLKDTGMDDYMDRIDALMYEDKKAYYQTHTRYDRNKN